MPPGPFRPVPRETRSGHSAKEIIVLRLVEGAVANTVVGAPVGGVARLMEEKGEASRGKGPSCMKWLHRTQTSGNQGRRGERGMGLDDIW